MSNHLGNFNDTWLLSNKSLSGINPVRNETGILTVINDIKVPYLECTDILYKATIMRTYDYSPFGVQLDDRSEERQFCESSTTTALVTDLDNDFNDGTLNRSGYASQLALLLRN